MKKLLSKSLLVVMSFFMLLSVGVINQNNRVDFNEGFFITAQAAAKKIHLKKKKVTLKIGKSYTQKLINKKGKNIPVKKIKWKSANKKVATVSKKGKVTAKKAGKVKITATYKGKRYTFTVTVKANNKKPVINITEPSTEEPSTVKNTAIVTFPEGFTVVQIAERLENNSVCKAAEFLSLVNDKEFIDSLGYSFTSFTAEADRAFLLEGYIFPDTYEFYLNASAESVIKKIISNTALKLNSDYASAAQELGYTLDEIITMASIIQEEAYTDESMKLISSVLHNRIKSPEYGKLQCDVTIHYVNDYILNSPYLSGDTDKYRDLYNTYKCDGLPEGPICCPGIKAIEAALYPAESNYYFFVTDKNRNYYFSETYSEHTEKCKEILSAEETDSEV